MTSSVTMPVSEQLYTATMHHTSVADYGYSVEDLASGRAIPPSGARIDIAFEGAIEGPNLKGTIVGVDFGLVRFEPAAAHAYPGRNSVTLTLQPSAARSDS